MCEGFVKKIVTELRDNPELWEETVVLYSQTEASAPGAPGVFDFLAVPHDTRGAPGAQLQSHP
jgi:hypothetical protein